VGGQQQQGGFDNLDDTVHGLHEILDTSFREVRIDVSGSSALFSATGPRG